MRKLISLLTVLSIIVGLTACGSDKPDDLPVSLDASATQSFTLIAASGTSQSPEATFKLSDFASITEYVKYIEKADVLSTSYFEFSGIPATDDVLLSNTVWSWPVIPKQTSLCLILPPTGESMQILLPI